MKNQLLLSEAARWIEKDIRPNIYAVVTLKQLISVEQNGFRVWISGERCIYDQAAAKTLGQISRSIFKSAHRKFGKRLAVATTLEGDGEFVRYHLNFLIHRPDWLPFEDLKYLFLKHWLKNEWALEITYFEERTGDCVRYSLKEGLDSLLPRSTGF